MAAETRVSEGEEEKIARDRGAWTEEFVFEKRRRAAALQKGGMRQMCKYLRIWWRGVGTPAVVSVSEVNKQVMRKRVKRMGKE